MKEYTIKDIATALGVSKSTVTRAIKELHISPIQKNSQKLFFSDVAAAAICDRINPNIDLFSAVTVSDKPHQTASELPQTASEQSGETQSNDENCTKTASNCTTASNDAVYTAPPHQTASELDLLRSTVSMLQEQLAVKDRQIESLTAALTDAVSTLKLSEGNKMAEQLTAAMPEQPVPDPQPEQEPVKKSFFARLFGF